MKKQKALIIKTLLAVAPLSTIANPESSKNTTIDVTAKEQILSQIVAGFERKSGVAVKLSPVVSQDKITTKISERDPRKAIAALLADYNRIEILDVKGQLKRVIVTGRKGDGTGSALTDNAANPVTPSNAVTTLVEPLTVSKINAISLPEKYSSLNSGSVYSVELNAEALKSMKIGESISVSLPDGPHQVVHDNRFEHENGDITWVGYLKENGDDYRFITTLGKDYTVGRVLTTNGQYNLEQEGGQKYLIDVAASGMTEVTDEHHNPDSFASPLARVKDAFLYSNWTQQLLTSLNPIRAAEAASSTITLQVFYTLGLAGITSCATPNAGLTRINNLVATTNQAYIDSGVNIIIQSSNPTCVGSYTNSNDNTTALTKALTVSGQGTAVAGFPTSSGTPTVASLRTTAKADLVTFIRPFTYPVQVSCGVAWQNNNLSANYGFSIVSDGTSGRYYCTDYTLAHETGHTMGIAHGNTSANGTGRTPYSYGNGINGVFGTIMNYFSPRVGKFSNPAKTCPGPNPCGIANTNDNARSLNVVAATVAAFRQ